MLKKLLLLIIISINIITYGKCKMINITDSFINALIKVESGGNSEKIGKLGEIGILQIRQCVIDDVNRIYKLNYKLSDAKNDEKSKDICKKYLMYWGQKYQQKTGKVADNQILSKIWNGGTNGPNKKTNYVIMALNSYWEKVRKAMI